MPKEDSYTVEIMFNPAILMQVYKAMNSEKRIVGIKLRINTNDKMAAIICEHDGQYGLVMPMRG
jgi:DNA polymerase III sliding clamp (beta) subunit (PCNA family)